MPPLPPTAPRYMTRFRCIAEACEDTCCSGLTVPISEARWRLLRETVAGTPDAARVEALISPNPDGATGPQAGILGKREDGSCAFLDADRLCSLQRRHGEPVLPDGCSLFPRITTRWGEGVEVAGTLACPEAARLCLLAEDALERGPVPEAMVYRPEVARQVGSTDPDDAWRFHAETVREAMLRLLARREVPYASRLYALGQLARALGDFYAPGTEAFRGEARASAEARLAEVLGAFEAPAVLEAMHRELSAVELPSGPWAGICGVVMKVRADATANVRFILLARGVQASYGGPDASPEDAWRLHVARRERLEARHGQRMAQYFRHHALNHVLRHPFTESASLLDSVFRLALRASVVRWALLGHPAVVALCESEAEPPDAQARLDAAAVECFQLVAKHVEQSPLFLEFAQGLAGEDRAETFGRLLVLVKGL